jgi:flagellar M-ring protein FliF
LQKESLPVYPQNGRGAQELHQENGTYAITKHTTHSELGPGRIRRVTAAVVVNDRVMTQGAGKTAQVVWKPRSAGEMHQLEQLAQAAVGFDARRGDQVVMENVSFSTNVSEARLAGMEKIMDEARSFAHTQPGLMRTLAIAVCGILLVLFVLKPVAQQVNATLKEPLMLAASRDIGEIHGVLETPSGIAEIDAGRFDPVGARRDISQQGVFDRVSEHIRRDPAQSKRLLESWIGAEDGRNN